jgi:UDP:flavonoid glycosyltransferase YjiC (YdhE family)
VLSCGTTTAVLGALTHGLPSVLFPGGGETPDNSEKVTDAGCALSLKADALAPDALYERIAAAAADAAIRRNCREMQAALARMDGFTTAAALVEQLAPAAPPVRRPRAAALAV